jgi:N-acetylmuramoyl-L-alanine amidase
MMRRAARLLCVLAAAAGLAACGGPPPSQTPKLDRLYRGLSDSLPHADPTELKGVRILIDPGHGGAFKGTMGPDSLDESSVNLGVALYLWGLLSEAGADVHLTRAADRDFLTPADSALASDLQARVAAADSLHPDVFISIHHNAQPQRDPTYNRVETYYKAGDPASLDLAFAIHRHLMRNLGIDIGEVKQGNYYVLRNVDVPAVLGESSYLTHPPVEEKLRLSRTQELEAEAYFLGILDYCRRGIPRVVSLFPTDSLVTRVPVLRASFEDRRGVGIDPDGVTMTVNGAPVDPLLSSDGTHASFELPWDAPNQRYDVEVSARNLRGNTSPIARTHFVISHPPSLAAITSFPDHAPSGGGSVRVRARVLDRRGLPVADGTPVSMTSSVSKGAAQAVVVDGAVEFALDVPPGVRHDVKVDLACGTRQFAATIPVAAGPGGKWQTVAIVDPGGRAIRDAAIVNGDSVLARESPSGLYGFPPADPIRIVAPGYRPVTVGGAVVDSVQMTPWFGGALLRKRFVLDPEGGTPRATGVGPLGLSASYVNLRVARYLEGFLRSAGADVMLTRTTEEVRLVEDVARLTNRFRADRYIEIRHPGAAAESALAVTAYYFPGSAAGESMARTVGSAFAARLGAAFHGPRSTVTYPLQQTACPAIVIAAPSIAIESEELRLDRASYQREQAYGMFIGILRAFGVTEASGLIVGVRASSPRDWMVTLDGTWTLVTDDSGTVRFDCVPPGPHTFAVRRGDSVVSQDAVTTGGDNRIVVDTGD